MIIIRQLISTPQCNPILSKTNQRISLLKRKLPKSRTRAYKDYINVPTAKWLTDNGKIKEIGEVTICSTFTNVCHGAKHKINMELSFKNEFCSIRTLNSKAIIIDSDIDIILGRR